MKCAVGKCMQNDGKKSDVSFYSFPKHNEQQRKLWIEFCQRPDTIKIHRERICSLHFKHNDFQRNLKYEMGYSNRATPKLKPGAVPSVEATEVLPYEPQTRKTNTDTNEDSLQLYIESLEAEIATLRQQNEMRKIQSEITTKRLAQRVQRLSFSYANLERALRRVFTEGQINKIKNAGKRQNFTEADIAHSITLYHASAKAYRLLKRKNFPLPSVRTLQRWMQKLDVKENLAKIRN